MPHNYVSEWFGYRVYPKVAASNEGLRNQGKGLCVFLTEATREPRGCVKPESSRGVCSISSCSNGPRQDWLVCPYRALSNNLLGDAASKLFRLASSDLAFLWPAPLLSKKRYQKGLEQKLESGRPGVIYFQDKLGGEISVSKTDASPEFSFDIMLVEIRRGEKGFALGRFGALEVQTMDFHGSYRKAVKNLQDALRLHGKSFHKTLQENQDWLSERIEGPNIANVFKRTFYQMALKFNIGTSGGCAGCVLAIPRSVWDSWQRHLGKPTLSDAGPGEYELRLPGAGPLGDRATAWIYVFDVAEATSTKPAPIQLEMKIATDADSLAYFALKEAPRRALSDIGIIPQRIRQRLASICANLVVSEEGERLEFAFE